MSVNLGHLNRFFLQHFVPHGKARFIPVDDFEFILFIIAKNKHRIVKRGQLKLTCDDL